MQMATPRDSQNSDMIVKRVSVPVGLEELMEGLTKEVLLKKPKDLYVFASEYFARLLSLREQGVYKGNSVKHVQSITKQSSKHSAEKLIIKGVKTISETVKNLSKSSSSSLRSDSPVKKYISAKKNSDKKLVEKGVTGNVTKIKKNLATPSRSIDKNKSNQEKPPRSKEEEDQFRNMAQLRGNRSLSNSRRGRSLDQSKSEQISPRQKTQTIPRKAKSEGKPTYTKTPALKLDNSKAIEGILGTDKSYDKSTNKQVIGVESTEMKYTKTSVGGTDNANEILSEEVSGDEIHEVSAAEEHYSASDSKSNNTEEIYSEKQETANMPLQSNVDGHWHEEKDVQKTKIFENSGVTNMYVDLHDEEDVEKKVNSENSDACDTHANERNDVSPFNTEECKTVTANSFSEDLCAISKVINGDQKESNDSIEDRNIENKDKIQNSKEGNKALGSDEEDNTEKIISSCNDNILEKNVAIGDVAKIKDSSEHSILKDINGRVGSAIWDSVSASNTNQNKSEDEVNIDSTQNGTKINDTRESPEIKENEEHAEKRSGSTVSNFSSDECSKNKYGSELPTKVQNSNDVVKNKSTSKESTTGTNIGELRTEIGDIRYPSGEIKNHATEKPLMEADTKSSYEENLDVIEDGPLSKVDESTGFQDGEENKTIHKENHQEDEIQSAERSSEESKIDLEAETKKTTTNIPEHLRFNTDSIKNLDNQNVLSKEVVGKSDSTAIENCYERTDQIATSKDIEQDHVNDTLTEYPSAENEKIVNSENSDASGVHTDDKNDVSSFNTEECKTVRANLFSENLHVISKTINGDQKETNNLEENNESCLSNTDLLKDRNIENKDKIENSKEGDKALGSDEDDSTEKMPSVRVSCNILEKNISIEASAKIEDSSEHSTLKNIDKRVDSEIWESISAGKDLNTNQSKSGDGVTDLNIDSIGKGTEIKDIKESPEVKQSKEEIVKISGSTISNSSVDGRPKYEYNSESPSVVPEVKDILYKKSKNEESTLGTHIGELKTKTDGATHLSEDTLLNVTESLLMEADTKSNDTENLDVTEGGPVAKIDGSTAFQKGEENMTANKSYQQENEIQSVEESYEESKIDLGAESKENTMRIPFSRDATKSLGNQNMSPKELLKKSENTENENFIERTDQNVASKDIEEHHGNDTLNGNQSAGNADAKLAVNVNSLSEDAEDKNNKIESQGLPQDSECYAHKNDKNQPEVCKHIEKPQTETKHYTKMFQSTDDSLPDVAAKSKMKADTSLEDPNNNENTIKLQGTENNSHNNFLGKSDSNRDGIEKLTEMDEKEGIFNNGIHNHPSPSRSSSQGSTTDINENKISDEEKCSKIEKVPENLELEHKSVSVEEAFSVHEVKCIDKSNEESNELTDTAPGAESIRRYNENESNIEINKEASKDILTGLKTENDTNTIKDNLIENKSNLAESNLKTEKEFKQEIEDDVSKMSEDTQDCIKENSHAFDKQDNIELVDAKLIVTNNDDEEQTSMQNVESDTKSNLENNGKAILKEIGQNPENLENIGHGDEDVKLVNNVAEKKTLLKESETKPKTLRATAKDSIKLQNKRLKSLSQDILKVKEETKVKRIKSVDLTKKEQTSARSKGQSATEKKVKTKNWEKRESLSKEHLNKSEDKGKKHKTELKATPVELRGKEVKILSKRSTSETALMHGDERKAASRKLIERNSLDRTKLHDELQKVGEQAEYANFKSSYNPLILRQEIKKASSHQVKAINSSTTQNKSTKNRITHALAALKIQALWRGYKVRQQNKINNKNRSECNFAGQVNLDEGTVCSDENKSDNNSEIQPKQEERNASSGEYKTGYVLRNQRSDMQTIRSVDQTFDKSESSDAVVKNKAGVDFENNVPFINAALRIQSLWRGINVRKKLSIDGPFRKKANVRKSTSEILKISDASIHTKTSSAIKIQSLWRGYRVRKYINDLKHKLVEMHLPFDDETELTTKKELTDEDVPNLTIQIEPGNRDISRKNRVPEEVSKQEIGEVHKRKSLSEEEVLKVIEELDKINIPSQPPSPQEKTDITPLVRSVTVDEPIVIHKNVRILSEDEPNKQNVSLNEDSQMEINLPEVNIEENALRSDEKVKEDFKEIKELSQIPKEQDEININNSREHCMKSCESPGQITGDVKLPIIQPIDDFRKTREKSKDDNNNEENILTHLEIDVKEAVRQISEDMKSDSILLNDNYQRNENTDHLNTVKNITQKSENQLPSQEITKNNFQSNIKSDDANISEIDAIEGQATDTLINHEPDNKTQLNKNRNGPELVKDIGNSINNQSELLKSNLEINMSRDDVIRDISDSTGNDVYENAPTRPVTSGENNQNIQLLDNKDKIITPDVKEQIETLKTLNKLNEGRGNKIATGNSNEQTNKQTSIRTSSIKTASKVLSEHNSSFEERSENRPVSIDSTDSVITVIFNGSSQDNNAADRETGFHEEGTEQYPQTVKSKESMENFKDELLGNDDKKFDTPNETEQPVTSNKTDKSSEHREFTENHQNESSIISKEEQKCDDNKIRNNDPIYKYYAVDIDPKSVSQNSAALKIQSSYRGYRVRRDLSRSKSCTSPVYMRELSDIKEEDSETKAIGRSLKDIAKDKAIIVEKSFDESGQHLLGTGGTAKLVEQDKPKVENRDKKEENDFKGKLAAANSTTVQRLNKTISNDKNDLEIHNNDGSIDKDNLEQSEDIKNATNEKLEDQNKNTFSNVVEDGKKDVLRAGTNLQYSADSEIIAEGTEKATDGIGERHDNAVSSVANDKFVEKIVTSQGTSSMANGNDKSASNESNEINASDKHKHRTRTENESNITGSLETVGEQGLFNEEINNENITDIGEDYRTNDNASITNESQNQVESEMQEIDVNSSCRVEYISNGNYMKEFRDNSITAINENTSTSLTQKSTNLDGHKEPLTDDKKKVGNKESNETNKFDNVGNNIKQNNDLSSPNANISNEEAVCCEREAILPLEHQYLTEKPLDNDDHGTITNFVVFKDNNIYTDIQNANATRLNDKNKELVNEDQMQTSLSVNNDKNSSDSGLLEHNSDVTVNLKDHRQDQKESCNGKIAALVINSKQIENNNVQENASGNKEQVATGATIMRIKDVPLQKYTDASTIEKCPDQPTHSSDTKLVHTSEFHDTVVVPLYLSPPNTAATVQKGEKVGVSRLHHTSEFHDTLVVPVHLTPPHTATDISSKIVENISDSRFTPTDSMAISLQSPPLVKSPSVYGNIDATNGRLIHTGELHDTVVVPVHIAPPVSEIASCENGHAENRVVDADSIPDGVNNVDGQDNTVLSTGQQLQVPAGVAVLTSPQDISRKILDGVPTAQASTKDAFEEGTSSAEAVARESSMDSEKRNNATTNNKNMEAQAATKIQAGFRGYQVRKQLKLKNGPSDISNQRRSARRKSSGRLIDNGRVTQNKGRESDLEEKSAVKIQAGVRGFLVRRRQKKQNK